MDELEIVLASYRDMFGVKTERANEIHRLACAEVARLRAVEHSLQWTGFCACKIFIPSAQSTALICRNCGKPPRH
jgi:hypothetical protein